MSKPKTLIAPFNLKLALSGNAVVLRNGKKAYVRAHEDSMGEVVAHNGLSFIYGVANIGTLTPDSSEKFWNVTRWYSDGVYTLNCRSEYDIVGMWQEPALTFDYWHLVAPEITHIAKDSGEVWFGFTRAPRIGYIEWHNAVWYNFNALSKDIFPKCHWKDSLIARPQKDSLIARPQTGVNNAKD